MTENTNHAPPLQSKAILRKKTRRALLLAILLSVFLIHLPLLYFFIHSDFWATRDLENATKQQVVMVNLKDLPNTPQRVVDLAKPKVEKVPQNPSAQSLYNSSVDEETVSRSFSKTNAPLGQSPQQQKQPQTMQEKLLALKNEQAQKENQKYEDRFEEPQDNALDSLQASIGSPAGGNTDDFLPDYKVGNRTYLNTLANPNIAYYVELRRKFRFAFNPIPVLRRYPNMISRGQIATVWGVSVNAEGQLAGLTLLRGSGLDAYDNEARRTIASSAPFSKPPADFLTTDGQLHMAWTFVVYL
jgi:outer membrane biosynthesis protein TonB